MLKLLDISGSIASIDAIGYQENIAKTVVSKGADYVLAVKKNQKILHEEISDLFATAYQYDFKNVAHEYYEGHGRIEPKRYWLSNDLSCLTKKEKWAGLKTIGMAESERNIGGKITVERRFFISSLAENAKNFGLSIRKHCAIENSLHWVLDETSMRMILELEETMLQRI